MTTPTPFAAAASLDLTELDGLHEASISQELSTLLTSIRRHLHMYPEVGFQEVETARFIREMLEMHGLEVHGPIAQTGLYVDIDGAYPGPSVGYRADIDALPIQDEKSAPYASQNAGVAHLCGHDAHTAVAIGVALLLHRYRQHLHGHVRVFFQPNEEGIPSGAPAMVAEGVLDGLEAVYAIHVDPTLEAGRYGVKRGPITAAASQFSTFVRGTGTGHSARPHEVVDTVWVSTQIMQAFYQLAGRIADARDNTIITLCRLRAGEAFNVIPAEAEFGGTLRCTNNDDRMFFMERMKQVAAQTAALYGGSAEVVFVDGAPAVINDDRLADHVAGTVAAVLGQDAVYRIPRPSMGTEDFAFYTEHIPGILIRAGSRLGEATGLPLHDCRFDIDEQTLAPTAQVMARILLGHTKERVLG